MDKFELKSKIDSFVYGAYNLLSDLIYIFDFPTKKIIKKNRDYHDLHKGERCFILGTGPSLKEININEINKLKHEITFGVNSFYKSEVGSQLKPSYYTLMDNLYWEKWSETFERVVQKYKNEPPVFITDLRAKHLIDSLRIKASAIYIHSKKYPTSRISEKIDQNIFAAMNVVSYSILTAIYMGFEDIYLLGCDYNAFCLGGRGHCYEDLSEVSQTNYNLSFYLKFYWITTEFHYLIAKLAKQNNIRIKNLTPNSLLDAYPKEILGDII
jgi:hypothetical protein